LKLEDAALRERELALKEREAAIKEAESKRAGGYFPDVLKSPLTLAVVGLIGTGFGAAFQGFWNLRLEQQKFESDMIKLALQKEEQKDKADFLNFLKSTGIVTLFDLQNVDKLAKENRLPTVSLGQETQSVAPRPLLEGLRPRLPMARLIASEFAAAGYGRSQQIAAVAVAIMESRLDPAARSAGGGQEVGLFQINMQGGFGMRSTLEQLSDPKQNVGIVIKASQSFGDFKEASSLEIAVNVFVRKISRPANPDDFVRRAIAIGRAIQALEGEWFPPVTP
jgi:hypothetical protein